MANRGPVLRFVVLCVLTGKCMAKPNNAVFVLGTLSRSVHPSSPDNGLINNNARVSTAGSLQSSEEPTPGPEDAQTTSEPRTTSQLVAAYLSTTRPKSEVFSFLPLRDSDSNSSAKQKTATKRAMPWSTYAETETKSSRSDLTGFPRITSKPHGQSTNESVQTLKYTELKLNASELVYCLLKTPTIRDINLQRHVYREIHAMEGIITAELKNIFQMELPFNFTNRPSDEASCYLRLVVPAGMHVCLEVVEQSPALARQLVAAHDPFYRHKMSWTGFAAMQLGLVFTSEGNSLYVRLRATTSQYFTKVRFVARKEVDLLEHHQYNNERSGIVQTPRYDRQQRWHLPWSLRPFVVIRLPAAHVIMVSVPQLYVKGCIVFLRRMNASSEGIVNNTFCCIHIVPDIFTTELTIIFVPHADCSEISTMHEALTTSGFMLRYSLHPESTALQKTPEDKWNCTAATWLEYQQHFPCNFNPDCLSGEDEVGCPYYSPECGLGFLLAHDACLFVMPTKQFYESDWMVAAGLCRENGGRLASLKTVPRFQQAFRIVDYFTSDRFVLHVGLSVVPYTRPLWYRNVWNWSDGTTEFDYYVYSNPKHAHSTQFRETNEDCGLIQKYEDHFPDPMFTLKSCMLDFTRTPVFAICERVKDRKTNSGRLRTITIPALNKTSAALPQEYMECPEQHLVHSFRLCDVKSACWSRDAGLCRWPLRPLPPGMACQNGGEMVPYSLVCDHHPDCSDRSDEDFCFFPPCTSQQFQCTNTEYCDGWKDCFDGTDEVRCEYYPITYFHLSPPAIIDVSLKGRIEFKMASPTSKNFNATVLCPSTHFQCPNNGYCLPVFFRCNGYYDCPYHEDEAGCEDFLCPGYFRCRDSLVCLHPSNVCDGHPHCPQLDDELLCNGQCPTGCICYGLAFFCAGRFFAGSYPELRFLDAHESEMDLGLLDNNPFLMFLNLSNCSLSSVEKSHNLPNLLHVDFSFNNLISLSSAFLRKLPRLVNITLNENPLTNLFDGAEDMHLNVKLINLIRVPMLQINIRILARFPNLQFLNLSYSGLQRIIGNGFKPLKQLRVLDLRGCPLNEFPGVMFQSLNHLEALYGENFKLCCPSLLPDHFNTRKCEAPADELSSCDDLLKSRIYTACVFAFATLGLIGNAVSFFYRTFVNKRKRKLGFGVFVTHLAVSDFLMGVYLAIIGVSDEMYRGRYLWHEHAWRGSLLCNIAGFLSFTSSETSAVLMSLITAERFLVLRFPFSQLRFGVTSAHVVSAAAWTVCLAMGSLPIILQRTSGWRVYSQSGICSALPIVRRTFPGRDYAFAVVIVFNFILCLFIILGQVVIYWSVQANAISASHSTKKVKEQTIARRLLTVALSNFTCWFPIGLLGLLAAQGMPVSDEINVSIAVFILPLNAALNPFLYTLNIILEKRRLANEERIRKTIIAQMQKVAGLSA